MNSDILITNYGVIIKNEDIEKRIAEKNVRLNYAFISSAVASMVNDRPDYIEVTKDVYNIKLIDVKKNKSVTIPAFFIENILSINNKRLIEIFNIQNKKINSYKYIIDEFKINNFIKCGALINKDKMIVRKMSINDSHIQAFDRDLLGFFLYIHFSGYASFTFENGTIVKVKFVFSRIPLLCMKSDNALKNESIRKICSEMIKKLHGSETDIIFC